VDVIGVSALASVTASLRFGRFDGLSDRRNDRKLDA
jgi:hypothetical protein